jgi:hypothetical protein
VGQWRGDGWRKTRDNDEDKLEGNPLEKGAGVSAGMQLRRSPESCTLTPVGLVDVEESSWSSSSGSIPENRSILENYPGRGRARMKG